MHTLFSSGMHYHYTQLVANWRIDLDTCWRIDLDTWIFVIILPRYVIPKAFAWQRASENIHFWLKEFMARTEFPEAAMKSSVTEKEISK